MSCEQENHVLDQLNGRPLSHKMQTSDLNRIPNKSLKTPSLKGLKSSSINLKTSLDKSSRKAFGNVSNVLHSGSQQSIDAKHQIKAKPSLKESDPLPEVKSDVKSDSNLKQNKWMSTEVGTDGDSKFFDEIEDMFPIKEELISDELDPITVGLYEIDEQMVLGMPFDSDLDYTLVPNNRSIFDLL